MTQPLIPKRVVFALAGLAVVLLAAIALLFGLGRLLASAGDLTGSRVVDYVALALGVGFCLDLILLVITLGIQSGSEAEGPSNSSQ